MHEDVAAAGDDSRPWHYQNVWVSQADIMQELLSQRGFLQASEEGFGVQAGCPDSATHEAAQGGRSQEHETSEENYKLNKRGPGEMQ